MEKKELEHLTKQLEKLNENLEGIFTELHDMNNTLDLIKDELRPKQARRRS